MKSIYKTIRNMLMADIYIYIYKKNNNVRIIFKRELCKTKLLQLIFVFNLHLVVKE